MSEGYNGTENLTPKETEQWVVKALIFNFDLCEESNNRDNRFTWLSFPTTKEAVQEALAEIGIDGVKYSRYLINGCEFNIEGLDGGLYLPENMAIDEINYQRPWLDTPVDVLVDKLNTFEERRELPTIQREIFETGVLIYG